MQQPTDFDESGTFNLAASIGKPKMTHFNRQDNLMMSPPDAFNNLRSNLDHDINDSRDHLFNLASSGTRSQTSNAKFA